MKRNNKQVKSEGPFLVPNRPAKKQKEKGATKDGVKRCLLFEFHDSFNDTVDSVDTFGLLRYVIPWDDIQPSAMRLIHLLNKQDSSTLTVKLGRDIQPEEDDIIALQESWTAAGFKFPTEFPYAITDIYYYIYCER